MLWIWRSHLSVFHKHRSPKMKKSIKTKPSSYWGSSLKHVLSDDSPTSYFVESTVSKWYDAKHNITSEEELRMLNSFEVKQCCFCNSTSIQKNGHAKNGLQRYKCTACNKRFTVITNTIFDSHKIPISEWIEYLLHLFEFQSISSSSRDNRNSQSTGQYWIKKVFMVLKHYQDDIVLSGNVYFDETYFKLIKSDIKQNELTGICVGVARDDNKILMLSENVRKESFKSTYKYFGERIIKGSTLIHDGNFCHNILISKLELVDETHKAKDIKLSNGKDNPLEPINGIHRMMKHFMNNHGSFERENLQDWLNLISFIFNKPNNRYEKVVEFIKLAINDKKCLRYRKK